MKGIDSKFDKAWFKRRLEDREMSQRQLAKEMGCDPASIVRLFNGERPLRMAEAPILAAIINAPVAEVLARAGTKIDDGKRVIQIVGHVDGEGEATINWQAKGNPAPLIGTLPPDTVAARMQTSSTPLDAFDGFTLYFAPPRASAPDSDFVGRLCLAKIKGEDHAVLKSLRRGYKQGTWNLSSIGAPDVMNALLEWACPVLLMRPPSVE